MPGKGSVKQKIRNGETVIGTSPGRNADRARLEALLNHYPYDFFTIDMQHTALNEVALSELCQIAADLETPVQLRTRHPRQAYLIGSIVDWVWAGSKFPRSTPSQRSERRWTPSTIRRQAVRGAGAA